MIQLADNYCVIVPIFNHSEKFKNILPSLLELGYELVLIDDGSDQENAAEIRRIGEHPSVHCAVHNTNRGKGAAVKTGLSEAQSLGFSHALQVDADGQHDLKDVDKLVSASRNNPKAMVVAFPEYDESIPGLRYYARYLTHFWVWVNTLSFEIKDSMCGFRVYPVDAVCELIRSESLADRMNFDVEVLVRWHWRQLPLVQTPTKVIYPGDGVSHFLPFLDNAGITTMHVRLFFGMLIRLPKFASRRIRQWFSER